MLKRIIKDKKAVGFVDSGVKILIAVVVGAVVLGGAYTLAKDTVIATARERIEAMFDYQEQTLDEIVEEPAEEPSPTLFSFTIPRGTFNAEEGMTWGEWLSSEYNTTDLSVIWFDRIGHDDVDGPDLELYYEQNGNRVYIHPSDIIDPSRTYKFQRNMPIDWL